MTSDPGAHTRSPLHILCSFNEDKAETKRDLKDHDNNYNRKRETQLQQKKLGDVVARTSTPMKPARGRLSDAFNDCYLSPIFDNPSKNKFFPNCDAVMKLGRPLLSSTKLDACINHDRLSNAVHLYQNRLSMRIHEEEAAVITSKLFHQNAMQDSFA